MDKSDIIIIRKPSKIEYDSRIDLLPETELRRKYLEDEGLAEDEVEEIFRSHEEQQKFSKELGKVFKGYMLIETNGLNAEIASYAKVLVSAGGDEHFKYVSHFTDHQQIVGINSDKKHSLGYHLKYNIDTLAEIEAKIRNNNFDIEKWTRLEGTLNGKKLELAVDTLYIGNDISDMISRYKLKYKGIEEQQKSSGILIVTGAGSTGWYHSVKGIHQAEAKFPNDSDYAKFIVREKFSSSQPIATKEGTIENGETLEIYSLMYNNKYSYGIISIDSIRDHKRKFNRGDKLIVRISDEPLKVIV